MLDSSDVQFSIQRALRMDAAGTSIHLLSALKRIETPDARTIRFHLEWADNQFGYALAGQAASIVDEEVFNPDQPLPLLTLPIGSGPVRRPHDRGRPGARSSGSRSTSGPRRGC